MGKLIPPKGQDIQEIIKTIYRDLNMLNQKISNSEKKDVSSDSKGSSGDIRVVTTGDKQYIEGKGKDGWARVELTK